MAKLPERPAAMTYTYCKWQLSDHQKERSLVSAVNRASNDVSSATTLGGSGLGLIG
jgi:hypothetical protein